MWFLLCLNNLRQLIYCILLLYFAPGILFPSLDKLAFFFMGLIRCKIIHTCMWTHLIIDLDNFVYCFLCLKMIFIYPLWKEIVFDRAIYAFGERVFIRTTALCHTDR